jgi:CHAD domain-containing protein
MGTNHQEHQEIEWQFDTSDLAGAEQWLRERATQADVQLHFGASEAQRDTYFDSSDWRFHRAGYALRTRSAGKAGKRLEATLKSFGTEDEGLRRRHEINELIDTGARSKDMARAIERAAGEVGARVRAVLGKHHLRKLFDVNTARSRVIVRSEGAPLAEIALDDVTIEARSRRAPVRIRRVEVELRPMPSRVAEERLNALLEDFRESCDLRPATLSKFEAGLNAQNWQPAFVVELGQPDAAEHLGDEPTIGELAFAVMREHFAQFLLREPGSRMGEEPEDVHRMRVATRRLRAAMSLFRDYLPEDAERLRIELGWVAQALGGVRDLDVQLERVRDWRAGEDEIDADTLDSLEALLGAQREPARVRLLHALDSARYEHFVTDYTAMLRSGPNSSASSSSPSAEAARRARQEMPGLILRRYAKVRAYGDAIDADSPAEELHELRIQCKRLRYALEFAATLYPKAVRYFAPRLVELQDLLGAHQDAYVAIAQLRDLSLLHQRELPTQTIFALGEISQRYAHQADELREQFPKLYRRIKGKAWQQVQRAMDET